jgi:hypothetical protein
MIILYAIALVFIVAGWCVLMVSLPKTATPPGRSGGC